MSSKVTLLDTIMSIPRLINQRILDIPRIEEEVKDIKKKKVVLIGSGTSYNAAFTIKNFSEKYLGLPIEPIYPNYFLNNFSSNMYSNDILYVFISQGGSTKSVLQGIDLVKSLGGDTLSLTENLDVPIAREAKYSLDIGSINEPFIYRTSGYSLTVLTLYVLLVKLSENINLINSTQKHKYLSEIEILPKDIEKSISLAGDFFKEFRVELKKCKNIFFAGGNDLWPVAQEANIKFMEMIPIVSESFELEEIIHGPQNCFTRDMGFFFLINGYEDLDKAKRISNFIKNEVKGFSLIIGNINENEVLWLETKSVYLKALVYVSFFQTLSYELSIDNGRDLSKKIYPQLDRYISKTI